MQWLIKLHVYINIFINIKGFPGHLRTKTEGIICYSFTTLLAMSKLILTWKCKQELTRLTGQCSCLWIVRLCLQVFSGPDSSRLKIATCHLQLLIKGTNISHDPLTIPPYQNWPSSFIYSIHRKLIIWPLLRLGTIDLCVLQPEAKPRGKWTDNVLFQHYRRCKY